MVLVPVLPGNGSCVEQYQEAIEGLKNYFILFQKFQNVFAQLANTF